MRSASAADASPIRGRSSNTSTAPRTSPRMPTTPEVGWMRADANWSSVVFPAPLGPSTTQRCPSSTSQETSSRMTVSPRTTLTPARARTSLMPRTLTESGAEHPASQDVEVHLVGLLADRAPGERLHGPAAPRQAHPVRACRVAHGILERLRQVGDEAVGVDRGAGAVLHLLDRHEPAGLPRH